MKLFVRSLVAVWGLLAASAVLSQGLGQSGPCGTNAADNAGLFYVVGVLGRNPLIGPPLAPFRWTNDFLQLSRVDTGGREITGFDPNYSPTRGYDPGNETPHDPDGSAQGVWREDRYTLRGSLDTTLYPRLGNQICRDGVMLPEYHLELRNPTLQIKFNRVWGNAIDNITYRPDDPDPASRQIVAGDNPAVPAQANPGLLVQSALFLGIDVPYNPIAYNPTEAGGIDEYDAYNSLRLAGSPVLSAVVSSPGVFPKTLETELRPINFIQCFARDPDEPADATCGDRRITQSRYNPLLWRGTFRRTTTLGFPLQHGVCNSSGATQCEDVITLRIAAKVDSASVRGGPYTIHSAFYNNFIADHTDELDLRTGNIRSPGSTCSSPSPTICDSGSAAVLTSAAGSGKPALGLMRSQNAPVLQAGQQMSLSYPLPNQIANFVENTSFHSLGTTYQDNVADETILVVGDVPTVKYRLKQIYCQQTNGAPLVASAMTMSPPGPAPVATPILFTAPASACIQPLEFRIWRYDYSTSSWIVLRDYSTDSTYTWTPGPQDVGTHIMAYWARSVGSPLDYEGVGGTPAFSVTGSPLSCFSVGISPAPPVYYGTTLTFVANCTGGIQPLQYNFWLYNVTTSTFVASSGYQTSSSWSWTPGSHDAATWNVGVWVKNAGSTAQYDTIVGTPYFSVLAPAPPPLSCSSVSISPTPPVNAGTTLTFTANCAGGVQPLQYNFWLYHAETGTWVASSGYTSGAWSWTFDAGTWLVGVWVRSADSSAQYDTIVGTPYFSVNAPAVSLINVVSGSYGANCGAPWANATGSLASACNGQAACQYTVSYTVLGDPAPGCAKDFWAQWTCGSDSTSRWAFAPAEAGFGSVVTLQCP